MAMHRTLILLTALFHLCAAPVQCLLLPDVISSHMVFQATPFMPRVWGTAAPNAVVTVRLNGADAKVAVSSAAGDWLVELTPQANSFGNTLDITAVEGGVSTTIQLTDISFGEVFLCSGQSNMELTVNGAYNASAEIANAKNYPNIRLYTLSLTESAVPLTNTTSKDPNVDGWAVASPDRFSTADAWGTFSATCWFFAINLYQQLGGKIPMGFVVASWGGTRVEAWSSPDALAVCNASSSVRSVRSVGRVGDPNDASHLWNGMIYPLLNLRFRGVAWYQGEANSGDPVSYQCTFPAMIADWRKKFGLADLFFYFAQLAPYNDGGGQYPPLRQAQLTALSLPHVNYAVLIDTNDPASPQGSIHPRDKQDVGYRLALHALAEIYGFTNLVTEGPRLVGAVRTQIPIPSWVLQYSTGKVSDGLQLVGSQQCVQCCNESPFIIISSDGSRNRAAAFVDPDDRVILIVLAAQLPKGVVPITLQFDWEDAPQCVLVNQYGLPAVPISMSLQSPEDA